MGAQQPRSPSGSLAWMNGKEPSAPAPARGWPRWLLAIAGLLVLVLFQPAPGLGSPGSLWFPSAGLGLVLVAWLGPRAAVLSFAAVLLSTVYFGLWAGEATPVGWFPLLAFGCVEGVVQAGFLVSAWWAYRWVGGRSDLRDPRSAVLFLAVFGAIGCLPAALHACTHWLLVPFPVSLVREAGAWWVAESLGIVALAPPLLVLLRPRLVRRGWIPSEEGVPFVSPEVSHRIGDWVEVAALTLATSWLSALLTLTQAPNQSTGWQLWGAPLLLVVWTGMRQGLPGATLVTAVSTVVSLGLLGWAQPDLPVPLLVQGNLLAQCASALLVAASSGWVRQSEARYRQVVRQIPVALYSARLLGPPRSGQPPRAEVHFVSPPSRTVLDCPPEELLGPYERWLNHVHQDDRELLLAALVQLSRQKQPVVCEYRLAPPSGEVASWDPAAPARGDLPSPVSRPRWLRDTLVPQFDPAGRLEGWEGIVSDITEQRLLADDLRRTASMFHALVSNMPAGVFFVSAKSGRPILVNQRARQLLGQREDFSAGLEHLSSVYRLHRSDGSPYPVEDLPVCQALQRSTVSMRDDIVVHRPDGRRIPLITWAAPLEISQSGRTDAVVWVLEDLTALRQAEAARRETEGRLRTVIESLAEGLLVQDRTGAVIDCNAAARGLLGSSLETSPPGGTSESWLWAREDGSPLPAEEYPLGRVLRTGAPVRNVVLGILPSRRQEMAVDAASVAPNQGSHLRWVLVNALPLAPKPGTTPAGVVTTLVDITDHIHAEHLIRASEERYRGLVDSLPLMVFQFDQQLRTTFLNPAALAITGYTLEEVEEPEAWQKRIHPEDLPGVLAAIRETLAGKPVRTEFRYRAKDGQERIGYSLLHPLRGARASPAPVATDHETPASELQRPVVGITALVLDMTRERRLEQELHRAQRLELVGRLSSGIAHDFNNLLTALLGQTETVRLELPADHPVQESLERMGEVGEQAVNLAQQILAYARQDKVSLRPVAVNRAVQRALNILGTLLPRTIEVESTLADREWFVQADEMQLQQVLLNLCLNARDAMPEGGRIQVSACVDANDVLEGARRDQGLNGTASLPPASWSLSAGRWVRLSIQDNGQGMTEEVRCRIFEPFFTTRERGTGLGLAVVHQIIMGFGGRIEVCSEPGKETRFDVWLPLAPTGNTGGTADERR
jgi:PAS domain S-box-containing protein